MQQSTLDAPDRAALRRAVFALRQAGRQRVFPAVMRLGDPDGATVSYPVGTERLDQGLRTDVVAALLRLTPDDRPAAWLVRPGVPEPHDLDRLWLAPVLSAYVAAGTWPRWFVVLTKAGWYDVLGSEAVRWKRLRIR